MRKLAPKNGGKPDTPARLDTHEQHSASFFSTFSKAHALNSIMALQTIITVIPQLTVELPENPMKFASKTQMKLFME